MEKIPNIEDQVNEALSSAKKVQPVEVPAFFTDRTVNRLKASAKEGYTFSPTVLLKIAAVILLVCVNVYTIKYVLSGSKQDTAVTPSVKDIVNEYQPNDTIELTIETRISNE
ncbi:MAG TPA: hypothetical protein VNZ45_08700 [Bacteroidia bacterium]|jgi:hypothetical protein|nr:hypothetical protein [Bacteroidia bacterium]